MMGGASSGKKQREVYVGNLTIGAVTDAMLRELFNGALSHLMPNPELNPPVVNVGMDPSGRGPSPWHRIESANGSRDGMNSRWNTAQHREPRALRGQAAACTADTHH